MLSAMQATAPVAVASVTSDRLRQRMSNEPSPSVVPGDSQSGPDLAAQIVLAGKKRRGEI